MSIGNIDERNNIGSLQYFAARVTRGHDRSFENNSVSFREFFRLSSQDTHLNPRGRFSSAWESTRKEEGHESSNPMFV